MNYGEGYTVKRLFRNKLNDIDADEFRNEDSEEEN